MQISTFCFDWNDVQKRTSPEQIVEEMIHTDDIDIYSKSLPDGVWPSDSASQHFATADEIAKARAASPHRPELEDIATVISTGDALDELGLSPPTDGCYFVSISPGRIGSLLESFRKVEAEPILSLSADAKEWIGQWRAALEFAKANGYGLLGHCG